ncbi:myoD family inhibitor [Erinaceus europaeus]|uniref:MyoD family inhibitor n=1 Tax=Erinaceus europaeus TaxID=9365 RepID=A0ABM3XAC4_ERIEU|nr:myoD family inhibitor [Erinaceus europaeus]
MSQVSVQRPPLCEAPHGASSVVPGPEDQSSGDVRVQDTLVRSSAQRSRDVVMVASVTWCLEAQTPAILPGLDTMTESTHPAEATPEESFLEEVAPPMPQDNDPGVPQGPDTTDLSIPIEAVTRQPQGNPLSCTPLLANGSGQPLELSDAKWAGNGALGGPKAHRKLQTHPSLASQGSKKSKGSTKSAASQIPLQAQEDCCVHCILSCLFCEFLTLCNIVLDCATCGSCSSEDSCLCCCCCGSGECSDCDLPCDLDCGILDACCESADCLEICMECCGLCFSS